MSTARSIDRGLLHGSLGIVLDCTICTGFVHFVRRKFKYDWSFDYACLSFIFCAHFGHFAVATTGAGVRITPERQAEIELERQQYEQAKALKRRSRQTPRDGERQQKRQQASVSCVPTLMQLNRASLRSATVRHANETIATWSSAETTARLEYVEEIWSRLQKDCSAFGTRSVKDNELKEITALIGEAEREYSDYKAKLRNHLAECAPGPSSYGQPIQIHLAEAPKVPKFSGREADWANFRAIYEAEVHNNTKFSDAQKMRHLLAALQGRAEQIYKNWPIGDGSSYAHLWTEMRKQYENEYNTVRAHLHSMFTLEPLSQPTCDAMRKLLDSARGSFRQLELLLRPEEIGEFMLLHQLEQMLDRDSKVQWAARHSSHELPKLADMFQFLECRASLLSQLSTIDVEPRIHRPGAVAAAFDERVSSFGRGDEPRPRCDLCPGQRHWPFRCVKYKGYSIRDRLAYINQHNRCLNCFSSRHRATSCPEKPCPRCRQKHNSTLCPIKDNVIDRVSTERRGPRESGPQRAEAKRGFEDAQ